MMTTEDLKKIAAQLRSPSGENGIEMGKSMNEKNIGMIMSAIESLSIKNDQCILELGHGNGGHIKHILEKAVNVRYVGLEISSEMKVQASQMNWMYLPHELAEFKLYNGLNIPFKDATFDHTLSVNTLYFWEAPCALLSEIWRVLKPNGTCCITFADKSFMDTLPFTEYGFQLYDFEKFENLICTSQFSIQKITKKRDRVISKIGQEVIRKYFSVVLHKE